jgi:putative tryptophan/tyrosine transport system substrate-binding protein
VRVVGVLSAGSRSVFEQLLVAFREGLRDFGFEETKNFAIDYRFADGRFDQLMQMAEVLARCGVAVVGTTSPGAILLLTPKWTKAVHVASLETVRRLNSPNRLAVSFRH